MLCWKHSCHRRCCYARFSVSKFLKYFVLSRIWFYFLHSFMYSVLGAWWTITVLCALSLPTLWFSDTKTIMITAFDWVKSSHYCYYFYVLNMLLFAFRLRPRFVFRLPSGNLAHFSTILSPVLLVNLYLYLFLILYLSYYLFISCLHLFIFNLLWNHFFQC